jgi:hypothetical protein
MMVNIPMLTMADVRAQHPHGEEPASSAETLSHSESLRRAVQLFQSPIGRATARQIPGELAVTLTMRPILEAREIQM